MSLNFKWVCFNLFTCLMLGGLNSAAQDQFEEDQSDQVSVEKKIKVFPVPIFFYTPETGFGFGAGVTSVIKTENGNFTPRKSQLALGGAYTTREQTLLYLPFNYYLFKQRLFTTGEVGYFNYTFRFFGIGSGSAFEDAEFYRAKFPRLRLNAYYQIKDGVFLGPKVIYDKYTFLSFEDQGRLEEGNVPGSKDHTLAMVGSGLILDRRNNNLFPTKGYYLDLSYQVSVNANYKYYGVQTDFSYYFNLNNKGVVAANFFSHNVMGNTPFTAYPSLGGTKKLRGYIEGSILNKSVTAIQAEIRQMLFWRVGVAGFLGVGFGAERLQEVQLQKMQLAGGAGVRVRLTDKLNARIDYAVGLMGHSGFYITFGEAF